MSKAWTFLADQEVTSQYFWVGVDVWIDRPHLVNRRLLETEKVHGFSARDFEKNLNDENFKLFVADTVNGEEFHQYLRQILPDAKSTDSNSSDSSAVNDKKFTVVLRKLIPRNTKEFGDVLQAVIKDENKNTVTFWPRGSDALKSAITPNFPYRIRLSNDRIIIETLRNEMEVCPSGRASENWLKTFVLPKIAKWCCRQRPGAVLRSLNLISVKSYSVNYNYLKEKYAKKYIEMWPESSDPLKYVYEDIAIAAYLITLWEEERAKFKLSSKQTFVDLGCGNGLLVDILTSEGHKGTGIDVRRRKIWSLYEPHTTLIEKTIEPSEYHLFPNHDWIIGNHSDELTPWIPVIAARSSYNTRAFILPCCAYTFNGKFKRRRRGYTKYESYLTFLHTLCLFMGFKVREDKLRIPSTRRICFVCASRSYYKSDEECFDNLRKKFIEDYSQKTAEKVSTSCCDESVTQNMNKQESVTEDLNKTEKSNWIKDFKPRERVELVQNCTQLDRKFLDDAVLVAAKILLKKENYISLQRGSDIILWNSGGKMKLEDLIKRVDPEILKGMKKQRGGFQTFLRNHKNVFQIIDGGVQLTVPGKEIPLNSKPAAKRKRLTVHSFKKKPCFFFFHHPQGCPLEDTVCNFSHKSVEK